MAQNEMKAKTGLPERVRLKEGLGVAMQPNDLVQIHKSLFSAVHIESLVLARVVAHILDQHVPGSQEDKRLLADASKRMCHAVSGKSEEVAGCD